MASALLYVFPTKDSFLRMSINNTLERQTPMKLKTKIFTSAAVMAIACCFSSPSVLAQGQITGKVNFTGSANLDSTNLATATRVISWADTATTFGNTGSFAGVPANTPTMFANNWTFATPPITFIQPFWQFTSPGGNFQFNLFTSSVVMQTSQFLFVQGSGILTGTNAGGMPFTPTAGRWAFSIQDSAQGGGGTFTFSFSADTSANVPEGGSAIALLGLGLVVVEVLRRKLATA